MMKQDKERQILVVDDQQLWQEQICRDLEEAFPNTTIITLGSESEALTYIDQESPQNIEMVIADAILGPLERGANLLRLCRRRIPHAKRILISNKATREDLEYAINEAYLDGYIEKRETLTQSNLSLLGKLLSQDRVSLPINNIEAHKLCRQLKHIPSGKREHANAFKNTIKDLLGYIFYPWLVSPRTEVSIRAGTRAVDILFYNASHKGVFADIKSRYNALMLPVETKNTSRLTSQHFSQLEGYLTTTIGKCGILCFRGKFEKRYFNQVKAIHNEEKFVMLINEHEITQLVLKRQNEESIQEYNTALEEFLRNKYFASF